MRENTDRPRPVRKPTRFRLRSRWGARSFLSVLAAWVSHGHAAEPASVEPVEPVAMPKIIAHRGASYDAPENTPAAFALSWERNADGFECDVWPTGDGQIVCLHDADTGRVGDGGGAKGSGLPVLETALADLKRVDVGSWKSPAFADERPPTLDDALALVPRGERAKLVYVEIKSKDGSGLRAVAGVIEALDRSGLADEQIVVISFDADVVKAVKEAKPAWTVNWLTSIRRSKTPPFGWTPTIETVLNTLEASGADGLGCKAVLEHVDEAFVAALRERGYGFHLWTINDPDVARRAVELGVDSITTDRPGFLRDALLEVLGVVYLTREFTATPPQ